MTAREFWKDKFDEYPQNDTDKLAVAMMQQYKNFNKGMTEEQILFAMFLTGHSAETIIQIYNDWIRNI